jgi:hypothetical protein
MQTTNPIWIRPELKGQQREHRCLRIQSLKSVKYTPCANCSADCSHRKEDVITDEDLAEASKAEETARALEQATREAWQKAIEKMQVTEEAKAERLAYHAHSNASVAALAPSRSLIQLRYKILAGASEEAFSWYTLTRSKP